MITEESGIAKGIRRIIAVTGHEAQDVTRRGNDLKAKLDRLNHVTGKDKDAGLKAFTVVSIRLHLSNAGSSLSQQELGQSDISTILKADLRDRLGAMRKAFDKEIKDREAAINKMVRLSISYMSVMLIV